MHRLFLNIANSFTHFLFPHNCLGCATDIINGNDLLCARCATELPSTGYFKVANNPVEKIFYGRLKVENAAAAFYFSKQSLMQHLLQQMKYKGNREAGIYLGKMIGYELLKCERFDDIDALVPLPLNPKKEFKRGYNQSMLICEGIASVWDKPILKNAVIRTVFTETQTNKSRINRWENMDGVFAVATEKLLQGKHILLIDDVVTSGATLEACGSQILQVSNTKLSIACVACTG